MPHDINQQKEAGKKGGQDGKSHGLYAFRDRGPDALDKPQRSRYLELRDQLATAPGREEYLLELAAHLAMMMDLGFTELKQAIEHGRSIWGVPVTKRMATYLNALIRLLNSFPPNNTLPRNVTDLLSEVVSDDDAED